MSEVREAQNIEGFDAIITWEETQELLDAARRCVARFHGGLNNLDVPAHKPSNQEISNLLTYLAQKTANTLDVVPQNTEQNHYVPKDSADSFTAWLYAPASPWNPLLGGIRILSAEKTNTSQPVVRSDCFTQVGGNPQNSNSTNHEFQFLPSIPQSQPSLEALNSSALAQNQLHQQRPNSLAYQSINVRNNGRSSIAYSNETSQVDYPWSRESPKTSITTPPFQAGLNKRSHQALIRAPSTSSKSLKDDCSQSTTHEQVGNNELATGTRRGRPLTYAEAARSNSQLVQQLSESAVSPATTIGNNITKNKFRCTFPGCDKTFEWEWKYNDHSRSHTKEKPFSCNVCNVSFGRDRDLVKHRISQKHKKAMTAQSIEGVANARLFSPPKTSGGQSPGGSSNPSRATRRGAIGSRKGTSSVVTASVANSDQMEVSGETSDETGGTEILTRESTGNSSKANTCTSRPRSKKRIRINDIDSEASQGRGVENLDSLLSPADYRNSGTTYLSTMPHTRIDCTQLSPSHVQPWGLKIQHSPLNVNPSVNVSPTNTPSITVSSYSRSPLITAENQRGECMQAAENRTTTSSVMSTDQDFSQFINYDPPPTTSHTAPQANFWDTGGGDVLSPNSSEFSQGLPGDSYCARNDGGCG